MFIRRAVNSVSIVYLVILQLIVKFVLTEEIGNSNMILQMLNYFN